ncbi:MAG TPA: ABC-type transport auxiliary lipoprotein family protein [Candidatus Hydrogenedentes bacterium]|nr:ABC-type transport auxiliary lipoprotein family protein [Candidatus Hydrogenedentota bacterium]HNT87062.1 ABC-type transport auxiliary lipoprotein family protein [Candidatus Hydrogenedentota bacterium]
MKRITGMIGLVLAVAGCVSAPKPTYHTLDLSPAAVAETAAINVVVDQIRVAEPLRREEVLIKKSPTEIEYYAAHKWAASLSELVAQKLNAEFGSREPDRPTILVYGTLLAFEQVDDPAGPKAVVRLELQFRPDGASRYKQPLLERVYENPYRQEPSVAAPGASVEETVRAVVRALSDRLGALADAIRADAVRAHELAAKAEEGAADAG